MTRTTVKSADADGEMMNLHYIMTSREIEIEGDLVTAYGIRVEGRDGFAQVDDITSDRARADGLFALICRGEVTPMTLRDIVEDWLE